MINQAKKVQQFKYLVCLQQFLSKLKMGATTGQIFNIGPYGKFNR